MNTSSSPVTASAGNTSHNPASGSRAPWVNTGSASVSSPYRANARSSVRGTGSANTANIGAVFCSSVSPANWCAAAVDSTSPATRLPAQADSASTTIWLLAAALRASHPTLPRRRPNATRTVAVDTPVSAPIAANDHPRRSSSRIRATTSSVSLIGPVGPGLPGTSPATPSAANPHRHRHSVSRVTANPDATCDGRAISVSTSCTAANRRPTSSPASKQNVASPFTYTTEPSPGLSTSAAIGPIGVASAGVSGSTGWVTTATVDHLDPSRTVR